MRTTRVDRRNATFQHWQVLLTNRTKRTRAGEVLVQGVRPVTLAVEHGWPVRAWLTLSRRSAWAEEMLRRSPADCYVLADDLYAELAEREEGGADLIAVAEQAPDALSRIPLHRGLVLVFDRPSSPGNIGTIVRSLDALGGAGLVVTGHAADPYDPKAVRASTGSLFSVPVVRAPSHREVLTWLEPHDVVLLGTDEGGDLLLHEAPLGDGGVVVIGSETRGMSAGWREACERTLMIPMAGRASSLNASSAATAVLYEAQRQRLTR